MAQPTILVVDDEASVCDILEKILTNAGYAVFTAGDAASGLETFLRKEVQLVLLDLVLPDEDGMKLARKMIATKPHVPIVMISSYGTISRAVQATKEGAFDFLEKPLDRERLLITVRNALAQQELVCELDRIRSEAFARYHMVGSSPAIQKIYEVIERAAPTTAPVLVTGEPGVGKELVAQAVHDLSPRRKKRLVKVNCGAIPDSLFESELFGHRRGAFTGAHADRVGRIEMADGGTLMLDEIGDLSAVAQAKLLRFLENHEIQPVGAAEPLSVDVRVIAATNKNLLKMVKEGEYREDLYFRLDVIRIDIPPLRERREDIPALLDYFLDKFAEKHGRSRPRLSEATQHFLHSYDWPGNVRQLRNWVERVLVFNLSERIDLAQAQMALEEQAEALMPPGLQPAPDRTLREATRDFERGYVLSVIEKCGWNMSEAARLLGINRTNLYRKLQQLGIDPQRRGR